jgi:hypothetical protein
VPDPTAWSAFASLLTEIFLHKPLGMLNASLPRFLRPHAPGARAAFPAIAKKPNASKTRMSSTFSRNRENSRAALLDRAAQRGAIVTPRRSRRKMWCRFARERDPSCKNTGFFAAL